MPDGRHGSCNCGAVKLTLRGDPKRVGLCHCLTCRKESGGPFMAFAVWDAPYTIITGETHSWKQTTDYRHFCPKCGSTLFGTRNGDIEVEVRLGCFDEAPTDLTPAYELWTIRREHWQPPITDEQHEHNRRGT
jgi:hypothetical protein